MNIVFTSRTERARGVWELSLTPEKPVEYTPGQYARLTFPFHIGKLDEVQHRTFTFISHPSQPYLRFITRIEAPLSPYKQQLLSLRPGATMHIDEPRGDAVLPRLTTPLVFIAQGIALASYISMLTESVISGRSYPITLLWVRRSEDNPLEKLIPGEIPNLSRVDMQYPNRLSVSDILPHIQPNSLIYLSGSQTFVENLGLALEARGILRERLIYDYYEGYVDL